MKQRAIPLFTVSFILLKVFRTTLLASSIMFASQVDILSAIPSAKHGVNSCLISLLLFLFVFTGLKPDKLYYYRCGDPSIGALSDVYSFKTMPVSSPRSYPKRIAVMGDLGLTYNTSTTISHVISNKPQLALLVGDVTYANLYLTNGTGCDCYSCSFPNSPIHETYQPRWDYWGRYACSLISLLLQSASGDCIVNVLICKFLQVHAAFSF